MREKSLIPVLYPIKILYGGLGTNGLNQYFRGASQQVQVASIYLDEYKRLVGLRTSKRIPKKYEMYFNVLIGSLLLSYALRLFMK